ncbi:GH25 family lysozyme [Streptomyces sp. NPDC099088]|uniref:GH25 family lysozyme n=1 Tax=Streptomyces sp. NPDC099088 TaxID=3366101 RepID=UPI00381FA28E
MGAAGLLRGAHHFAVPDTSSGTDHAAYAVRDGGAWRADGPRLPPALDIESTPYARHRSCSGLRPAATVRWTGEFSDEGERKTGRTPVVHTPAHWWNTRTGSSHAFAARHAFWPARHGAADPAALPPGWSARTFRPYDTTGGLPGDQDLFHGSPAGLERPARGWRSVPEPGIPSPFEPPHLPLETSGTPIRRSGHHKARPSSSSVHPGCLRSTCH